MDIKRKHASWLLDQIRTLVAAAKENPAAAANLTIHLENALKTQGINLPTPCIGEAHGNAFIDGCGCCRNLSWGWSGENVKVK